MSRRRNAITPISPLNAYDAEDEEDCLEEEDALDPRRSHRLHRVEEEEGRVSWGEMVIWILFTLTFLYIILSL